MKITTGNISNVSLTSKQPILPNLANSREISDNLSTDATVYTPSPELLRLLDQVRQQSDIREDKVSAVLLKLQQGYYSTSESNQKTAEAFLASAD